MGDLAQATGDGKDIIVKWECGEIIHLYPCTNVHSMWFTDVNGKAVLREFVDFRRILNIMFRRSSIVLWVITGVVVVDFGVSVFVCRINESYNRIQTKTFPGNAYPLSFGANAMCALRWQNQHVSRNTQFKHTGDARILLKRITKETHSAFQFLHHRCYLQFWYITSFVGSLYLKVHATTIIYKFTLHICNWQTHTRMT